MSNKRVIQLCVTAASIVLFHSTIVVADDGRHWTDSSGKFSVDAELIELRSNEVVLKKSAGSLITIARDRLSAADQKFLDGMWRIEGYSKTGLAPAGNGMFTLGSFVAIRVAFSSAVPKSAVSDFVLEDKEGMSQRTADSVATEGRTAVFYFQFQGEENAIMAYYLASKYRTKRPWRRRISE